MKRTGFSFVTVSFQGSRRYVAGLKAIPEDLSEFSTGRGRRDRIDSITLKILNDRKRHHERLLATPSFPSITDLLEDNGFGVKTRVRGTYELNNARLDDYYTRTGAGKVLLVN
jgi:hypothetical protein